MLASFRIKSLPKIEQPELEEKFIMSKIRLYNRYYKDLVKFYTSKSTRLRKIAENVNKGICKRISNEYIPCL